MILTAEHELEDNDIIPEDVKGKMRVGVGKAKMLLKKKFRLFEELCSKNLVSSPSPPISPLTPSSRFFTTGLY